MPEIDAVRKVDSRDSFAIAQARDYRQIILPAPSRFCYLCLFTETRIFFPYAHRPVLRSMSYAGKALCKP